MRLLMYYEHTPEWWGQAIWFYNKLNNADLPMDLFQAVEAAGSVENIPPGYLDYTNQVLAFWGENHRMAELVLPSK
jgi:hypothetical protein